MKELFPRSPTWLNLLTIIFSLVATAVSVALLTKADLAFVEALIPVLGLCFGGATLLGFLHGVYARKSSTPE